MTANTESRFVVHVAERLGSSCAADFIGVNCKAAACIRHLISVSNVDHALTVLVELGKLGYFGARHGHQPFENWSVEPGDRR